jgi:hypothetical protein
VLDARGDFFSVQLSPRACSPAPYVASMATRLTVLLASARGANAAAPHGCARVVRDAPMKASVWVSSRVLSRSASERRGPRSRTASPWTVAHVGYSMLRRRAGSRSPAWTRSSSAAWRCCNGCRSSFVSASGWSAAANAVSKRPGSLRANPRYALPTAWSRSRPRRCVCPRADLAHPVCHALSEPSDRLVSDRREQRVAVVEMPVGGIGNHPDRARDSRATRPRQARPTVRARRQSR